MPCCTGTGFGKLAIGVAVAAAAAFGSYNYLTTGCPLGTKAPEAAAETTLVAGAADTAEAKSCCPLSGAQTLAAAAPSAAVFPVAAATEATACCGAGCDGDKAACPAGLANCADKTASDCADKASECAETSAAGCDSGDAPACHDADAQADAAPATPATNG